jgi:hypothetical protein
MTRALVLLTMCCLTANGLAPPMRQQTLASRRAQQQTLQTTRGHPLRNKANDGDDGEDVSLALKAAWLGTEILGNVASALKGEASSQEAAAVGAVTAGPPRSMGEAAARLREDYGRDYFVTGAVDAELYAPDCVFADPFASFTGRQRFVDNLQNLGLFVVGADLRLLAFEEDLQASPPAVTTRVLVKLQLNLPWKPVLAWPWGVKHEYNPATFQINAHVESWDVSAAEGLAQVFRPGSAALLRKLESARKPPT